MKLKLYIYIALAIFTIQARAQDPIFTQYFVVPETLNPAFTGTFITGYTGIIHRSQWPDGNKRLDTDYGFINGSLGEEGEAGMGLGLNILSQREVFTKYNYTQINGAYSYFDDLNDNWKFSSGLEVGYGNKNYNFNGLLLEDQINIGDGSINGGTVDPGVLNAKDKINFFDISSGVLLYNEKAWLGASLKHLTRPNISFTTYAKAPLEMFFSAHGGYAFSLDRSNLLLTANYMRQNQYNRLDVGTVFDMKPIKFGVFAATNPAEKSNSSQFLTSINLFSSIQIQRLLFSYSYDINTSKFGNSNGVHEISLIWQLGRECRRCNNYLVKRPWGRNYED